MPTPITHHTHHILYEADNFRRIIFSWEPPMSHSTSPSHSLAVR